MERKRLKTVILALATGVCLTPVVRADKLATTGTKVEIAVAEKYAGWFQKTVLWLAGKGMDGFTEPVHEEVTQRTFGCDGNAQDCLRSGRASDYVLAGVRWNDDPPFRIYGGSGAPKSCKTQETIRFTTQPVCWVDLFRAASAKAAREEVEEGDSSLLQRSHFGDLQFIHAMATAKGELPDVTRSRMVGWAEFTWRVMRGEISLEADMGSIPVAAVAERFKRNTLRVQDLFTLGNVALRRYLGDVAFGSLLHMVQDSFAKGHAERLDPIFQQKCGETGDGAPGAVREFHVYGLQDSHRHGAYDKGTAVAAHLLQHEPDVVDVGRRLLAYRDANASWEVVRPYVECVFRLEDARPASAGSGFERQ